MTEIEFMRCVTKQPDGCWIWNRSTRGAGYGQCSTKDDPTRIASRLAYRLFKADPGELFVLHRCDVPRCCNPDHLFLGTARDNVLDMVAKGRNGGHPPGRVYNTVNAIKKLKDLYACEDFAKEQGRKISLSFAIKRDRNQEIPCVFCHNTFKPLRANCKFCSAKCKDAFNNAKKRSQACQPKK